MFEFTIEATSSAARTGTLVLPHGTIETPAFMPVGTQGTVRTLSPADLKSVGAQLVLANTYHLHVRPGEGVVQRLGGLHRFMGWDRPLLTDSGGFQVFSLEGSRRVDEDGVEFQSHVDGSRRHLPPDRRSRFLDRPRYRRLVRRRAEARHVPDARGSRAPAAARLAALSYGRGVPRGPRGGGGAGYGPVRLRGAHAQRAQWLGVHARRPGEHPQRRAPRGPAAARRDVRLRDLRHVLARLPAAPVRGGGAAGAAAVVAA